MLIKSAIVALFPAIVAAQNCADNTDFTFELDFGKEEGDITIQDCAWLTKNDKNEDDRISQYCKRGNVRFACRLTCESCNESCNDDESFSFNIDTGKSQDCDWFGLNNSGARIEKYCYRGEPKIDETTGATVEAGFGVGASCPKACGFCPAVTTPSQCFNDDTYHVNYDGRDRSCNNLRLNEGRRKALCVNTEVQDACPHTCGSCCVDQVSYKFWANDGVKRTCAWIARKDQENRRAKYCGYGNFRNGYVVRDRCASACGFCFKPVMEDSSEPSGAPTIVTESPVVKNTVTATPSTGSPTKAQTQSPVSTEAPTKLPVPAPVRAPVPAPVPLVRYML